MVTWIDLFMYNQFGDIRACIVVTTLTIGIADNINVFVTGPPCTLLYPWGLVSARVPRGLHGRDHTNDRHSRQHQYDRTCPPARIYGIR